jgi:N-acetylmuramoyl-L-alanine amidase
VAVEREPRVPGHPVRACHRLIGEVPPGSASRPSFADSSIAGRLLAISLILLLAACGIQTSSPTRTQPPSPPNVAPSSSPSVPAVEPAPGSDSVVYAPNPGAIVVAIDAGHGGCLDWGVPDPSERGQAYAEETMTLAIAQRLRDLLEADGIGVVMIRDSDEALAGDDYPPLDCHGPPWRDVNGDGFAGFGEDELPEGTRTRDELQARLDRANLAAADALVSIHINSPTQGGQTIAIAFSETFYTDETPWGTTETARLAEAVQAGVAERLAAIASYDRGDRGITAHNFYMVAPPLFEPTEDRPDPLRQPTRGGLMPVVLAEVGSITLREEHDLLVSAVGQQAVAEGLFDGLAAYLGARELAARIGLADAPRAAVPEAVGGDGPPYWAPIAPDGPLELRLTNTGTEPWPADAELVAGWSATDQPYLARAPEALVPLAGDVPALAPGESVLLTVELPPAPDAARAVAWISLQDGGATLADRGSPALQLATSGPP